MGSSVTALGLYDHQKRGVQLAEYNKRYGFWLEPGLGKSRIVVETIRRTGGRALIVAPLSILSSVWEEEFKKWHPSVTVCNLWETKKSERRNALCTYDVIIANFDTVRIHEKEIYPESFTTLVVDESSRLKGRTTKIAKSITRLAKGFDRVYLLSGTPAPNNMMEWFPQIEILRPGLLGNSFWSFRGHFFYPAWTSKTDKRIVYKWGINDDRREELTKRINTVSWSLRKKDCLDLPSKTFLFRRVHLSKKEWDAYEKVRRDLVAQFRDHNGDDRTVLAQNALVVIMKLRELTSGFAHTLEGDIMSFGHSKTKELMALLEEIGPEQVIVWVHFKEEARQVMEALPVGSYGVLTGDVPTSEREESLKLWREGKIRYLVAHPMSAGHGLTLTEASHAVYFSMSHSLELWLQSQDRIHRIGQKRPCTYHILEAVSPDGKKETIDRDIYRALETKNLTADTILNALGKRDT